MDTVDVPPLSPWPGWRNTHRGLPASPCLGASLAARLSPHLGGHKSRELEQASVPERQWMLVDKHPSSLVPGWGSSESSVVSGRTPVDELQPCVGKLPINTRCAGLPPHFLAVLPWIPSHVNFLHPHHRSESALRHTQPETDDSDLVLRRPSAGATYLHARFSGIGRLREHSRDSS